ncbi:hypothetical protein PHET_03540 [Paragonimus heterotremus]|uniref:BEN domain-containing protein n=1 Tax=Paragonimus heterotremus TaxID=100268 RepID=A0A8J4TBY7_9TREM|nr:hypothetical protein PHET_03540 [Paragonimus heterotremus]
MDSISALQYLSREQLENLIHRLQAEASHLKNQLNDVEHRNNILQLALPQMVRGCMTELLEAVRNPLKDLSPVADGNTGIEIGVQTIDSSSPLKSFASAGIQTLPEPTVVIELSSSSTQTDSPLDLDDTDSVLVNLTDASDKQEFPSAIVPKRQMDHIYLTALQTSDVSGTHNASGVIGSRRRKRKCSPAKAYEPLPGKNDKLPKSPSTELTIATDTRCVTAYASNSKRSKTVDVLRLRTANDGIPIAVNDAQPEEGGNKNSDASVGHNGGFVLLNNSHTSLRKEGPTSEVSIDSESFGGLSTTVAPLKYEIELEDTPPQPAFIGADNFELNMSEDLPGEVDWNELVRVRQEIFSNPAITMSRHWSLYQTASEWTRATCAMMSALFDPDQMANSTVLGRSSTEPRDRLPWDRVNFIVGTICQQFGVPSTKVRARMAQKCKDERRKRRLMAQHSSFDQECSAASR